jgi:hypothetical protein
MENGSANDYLKRNPAADCMSILRDVASGREFSTEYHYCSELRLGLEYLHAQKPQIFHGDLRGVSKHKGVGLEATDVYNTGECSYISFG